MCIWNPGGGLLWPTFIYKNKSFQGVSNLEMCMDYFSFKGRTCKNLNFCLAIRTGSAKKFVLVSKSETPLSESFERIYKHRGINTRGENWLLWKGPTVCCLICVLCHNFWTNYDLDLFSTSKWPSELQFCERYLCRWQKIG